MAFSDVDHLFPASRTEHKTFNFDENFHPMHFSCHELPDGPEFLMHI
jgi:hypothetical protein